MQPSIVSKVRCIQGEGSKREGSPHGLQGRLAQLEERLVCNQKAGGSNPPASTGFQGIESYFHNNCSFYSSIKIEKGLKKIELPKMCEPEISKVSQLQCYLPFFCGFFTNRSR
jgi:hypothetical protein